MRSSGGRPGRGTKLRITSSPKTRLCWASCLVSSVTGITSRLHRATGWSALGIRVENNRYSCGSSHYDNIANIFLTLILLLKSVRIHTIPSCSLHLSWAERLVCPLLYLFARLTPIAALCHPERGEGGDL